MKCIILEDEKAAQEVLMSYIQKTPFIVVLGIYESGLDIPIEELNAADVLFLDVQLPELNGLSFLKTIQNPPIVIVTSAFPNYAIDAFEEAVTDYLVKPFSYERFYKSIGRVRELLEKKQKTTKNQIFLYADKTIYKTDIEDIVVLKSEVDYVNVITKSRTVLVLDSLHNWSERLKHFNFVRVHRSYIINVDQIEKIKGNQVFINNQTIPIGRTYKEHFLKTLKEIGMF
ncbi:LytR/AlgR family response regulator transcription factor [Aquimarina algicola]|uniref:Response regulator transcription factor n=1 Tax=Aquimarina algicola TaxID=2589995 RepID=A0A504JKT4_9FLAO|nr:LytTR family DNA-binding domain-containing protein [Aquimarina algicola]TPN87369.1 response regulator transcription factor [Aquimarina algicola]